MQLNSLKISLMICYILALCVVQGCNPHEISIDGCSSRRDCPIDHSCSFLGEMGYQCLLTCCRVDGSLQCPAETTCHAVRPYNITNNPDLGTIQIYTPPDFVCIPDHISIEKKRIKEVTKEKSPDEWANYEQNCHNLSLFWKQDDGSGHPSNAWKVQPPE